MTQTGTPRLLKSGSLVTIGLLLHRKPQHQLSNRVYDEAADRAVLGEPHYHAVIPAPGATPIVEPYHLLELSFLNHRDGFLAGQHFLNFLLDCCWQEWLV